MGSGIEEWWTGDYPELSIKNFKTMKVYKHFIRHSKPFKRTADLYREAFWIDDNCDIYEWYDQGLRTGEKFGHDHNSDTRFYEHWCVLEEEVRRVQKVWLCHPIEWGVTIYYYPDYEESVSWSVENEKKVLETRKKFKDHVEGKKLGSDQTPDGVEDFAEEFWEDKDIIKKVKEWRTPIGQGVEKEFEEGKRKWGEKTGRRNSEEWDGKWEKTSQGSFEENNRRNRKGRWGDLRRRDRENEFDLKWKGERPGIGEGRHGDHDGDSIPLETIGSQLWALYQNLKENLENKLERSDIDDADQSIKDSFEEIKKDLEDLADPSEFVPSDSISAIRVLEALRDRMDLASGLLRENTGKGEASDLLAEEIMKSSSEKIMKDAINESLKTLEELKGDVKEQDLGRSKKVFEKASEVLLEIEMEPQTLRSIKNIEELLCELESVKRELIQSANKSGFDLKDLEALKEKAESDQRQTAESLKKLLNALPEGSSEEQEAKRLIDKAQSLLTDPAAPFSDSLADYLSARLEESKLIDNLVNQLKEELNKKRSLEVALTGYLESIKADQEVTMPLLQYLSDTLGSEEEKSEIPKILENAEKYANGLDPTSLSQNQFNETLQDFLPLRLKESEMLKDLIEKAKSKLEIHIHVYEELWKAIFLSEKIADNLAKGELPEALVHLKKKIEGFPAKPELEEMHKAVTEYAEVNLGLLLDNPDVTKDEIKDAETSAKNRASGKKKMMGKKSGPKLRSGRPGAKESQSQPWSELLDNSLKTVNELAIAAFGPRKPVQKHMEQLKLELEPKAKALLENPNSLQAVDEILEALNKFETEKQDIIKNLKVIDPTELHKNLVAKKHKDLQRLKDLNELPNTLKIDFDRLKKQADEALPESAKDARDAEEKVSAYLKNFKGIEDEILDLTDKLLKELLQAGAEAVGKMNEEQNFARKYIAVLPEYFGTPEHVEKAKELIGISEELEGVEDLSSRLPRYLNLRLEESKLVAEVCHPLEDNLQKLLQLQRTVSNNLSVAINSALSDQGNEPDVIKALEELQVSLENLITGNGPVISLIPADSTGEPRSIPDQNAPQAGDLGAGLDESERRPEGLVEETKSRGLEESVSHTGERDSDILSKPEGVESRSLLLENLEVVSPSNPAGLLADNPEFNLSLQGYSNVPNQSSPSIQEAFSTSQGEFLPSAANIIANLDAAIRLQENLDKLLKGSKGDKIKEIEAKSQKLLRLHLGNLEKAIPPEDKEAEKLLQDFMSVAAEIDSILPQTESNNLIRTDKRLDAFGDILAAEERLREQLEQALKNANDLLRDKENELESLRNQLGDCENKLKSVEGLLENKDKELADALKEMEDMRNQLRDNDEAIKDLKNKVDSANNEIKSLNEKVESQAKEIADAQKQISDKENQLKLQNDMLGNSADQNAKLLEQLNKDIIDKDKELDDLKSLLRELNKKLEDETEKNRAANEELLKRLADKENELASLNNQLKDSEDANRAMQEDLVKKLAAKDSELDSLNKNLKDLEDANKALNDELAKKLADKDNELLELNNKINELEGTNKALNEEFLKKLADKDNELLSANNQLQDLAEKYKSSGDLIDSLTKKLEESKNDQDALNNKLAELQGRNAELEGVIEGMAKDSEDKENELNDLRNQLAEADQREKDAQDALKNLSDELAQREKICKDLEDAIGSLNNQVAGLSTDLDSKSKALADASALIDSQNDKLNEAESLIAVQKDQLNTQKELLGSSSDKNTELIEKLSEEMALKSKDLSDRLRDLEHLRKELEATKLAKDKLGEDLDKTREDLKKSKLNSLNLLFKQKLGAIFKSWAESAPEPEPIIEVVDTPAEIIEDEDMEAEEAEMKNDYIIADQLINEENRIMIETNPIMISYKQIEGKTEKPMTYLNVFKFLEDIMDKKFETDKKDIKDLRQMRSMTEFLMESLARQFGIQSLALKFLGQFIPGFYQIYNEGHDYAIFFARLLQLFHPEPVPYSLALYLVKARKEFQPLIDNFERIMHDQGQKKNAKKEGATFGRSAYEAAGTGGLAFVADVVELVYSVFTGDRDSGTRALDLMKPKNVTQEDYVVFRICHKMAKLGETPDNIFNMLDEDGGGTVSQKEFTQGIKKDLDLWIPDSSIGKLLVVLDPDGTGEVTKKAFMSKINMKTFSDWGKNPQWTVTKASYLITMIEVYKYNQRKLAAHLNPNFLKFNKKALDKEEFEEILLGYEPSLNVYEIEKLFSEALTIDQTVDGASFKSTSSVMCKYGFGNLKSFKIKELLGELSTRKTVVDVSLTASEQPGHKKLRSSTTNVVDDESKTPKTKKPSLLGVPSAPDNEESKTPKVRKPSQLGVPPTEVDDGKSPKSKIAKKVVKK